MYPSSFKYQWKMDPPNFCESNRLRHSLFKKMVEQVDSLGSTVFWLNKLHWYSVINSCLEIVIGEGGHQE